MGKQCRIAEATGRRRALVQLQEDHLKVSAIWGRTVWEGLWSWGLFFFYNRCAWVAKLRHMVE